MAFVISQRCVKCGACESTCPNKAIVEEDKQFAIDYLKCVQCGVKDVQTPKPAIDTANNKNEE